MVTLLKRLLAGAQAAAATNAPAAETSPAFSGPVLTDKRGRSWCVTKTPFIVGRRKGRLEDEPCDLYLDDTEPFHVSRSHFAIIWIPSLEGFFVRDLGSKLGTTVNGQRIGNGKVTALARLRKGLNEIVLGPAESPFAFELRMPAGGY